MVRTLEHDGQMWEARLTGTSHRALGGPARYSVTFRCLSSDTQPERSGSVGRGHLRDVSDDELRRAFRASTALVSSVEYKGYDIEPDVHELQSGRYTFDLWFSYDHEDGVSRQQWVLKEDITYETAEDARLAALEYGRMLIDHGSV